MTKIATLGERGDLEATPGSRPWAIAVSGQIRYILRNAESSVLHAKRFIRLLEEHEGYKTLEDSRGRPFRTFAAFCQAKPPYGLGYDPTVIERIRAEERASRCMMEFAESAR